MTARQSRGVPTGGQFAAQQRTEATVSLSAPAPALPDRLRIDDYFDGGVADYVRTPSVQDGTHITLVPSDWEQVSVERVSIVGMKRIQSRVFKKHLRKHLAGDGDPDGGTEPWVVTYRGERWLLDGHHRVVAGLLRGETEMDCHVMHVDPGAGRVT